MQKEVTIKGISLEFVRGFVFKGLDDGVDFVVWEYGAGWKPAFEERDVVLEGEDPLVGPVEQKGLDDQGNQKNDYDEEGNRNGFHGMGLLRHWAGGAVPSGRCTCARCRCTYICILYRAKMWIFMGLAFLFRG